MQSKATRSTYFLSCLEFEEDSLESIVSLVDVVHPLWLTDFLVEEVPERYNNKALDWARLIKFDDHIKKKRQKTCETADKTYLSSVDVILKIWVGRFCARELPSWLWDYMFEFFCFLDLGCLLTLYRWLSRNKARL